MEHSEVSSGPDIIRCVVVDRVVGRPEWRKWSLYSYCVYGLYFSPLAEANCACGVENHHAKRLCNRVEANMRLWS